MKSLLHFGFISSTLPFDLPFVQAKNDRSIQDSAPCSLSQCLPSDIHRLIFGAAVGNFGLEKVFLPVSQGLDNLNQ